MVYCVIIRFLFFTPNYTYTHTHYPHIHGRDTIHARPSAPCHDEGLKLKRKDTNKNNYKIIQSGAFFFRLILNKGAFLQGNGCDQNDQYWCHTTGGNWSLPPFALPLPLSQSWIFFLPDRRTSDTAVSAITSDIFE